MAETDETHDIDEFRQLRPLDAVIAELAERQHGRVARAQLDALGIGRGAIEHRIHTGRLHRVQRGVFAVGHCVPSPRSRWMEAVLSGGPKAALSHGAAGALHDIRRWTGTIDVTVPRQRRSRGAIRFHEAILPPDETTIVDDIPVTVVARTVLDMAFELSTREVERVLNEIEIRRLWTIPSVQQLLDRYPGRRGVTAVRVALQRLAAGTTVTKSDLEEAFLAFLDERGLPRPEVNAPLLIGDRWFEVDCLWRSQGIAVELDAYSTHGTRKAFERDRSKLRSLSATGLTAIAVTSRQLDDEADEIEADLRLLLKG